MGNPISARPGSVGPVSDGIPSEIGSDRWGAMLVGQKGPKYLEWMSRGYMYGTITSPAAPAAIPIYSTATNSPTLWNPPNSGKLIVPLKINLGVAAIATYLDDSFLLAYTPSANEVATAGTFLTFTNIAPINLLLNGPAGRGRYANAAVTWTVQPTPILDLGFSTVAAGTEANLQISLLQYLFDGEMGLPPGTAISLVGVVASSTTYVTSFVFAELPLPAGM